MTDGLPIPQLDAALDALLEMVTDHILPLYGPEDLSARIDLGALASDGLARVYPHRGGYMVRLHRPFVHRIYDLTDAATAGGANMGAIHRREAAELFDGDAEAGRALAFVAGMAFAVFHEMAHVVLGHVDWRRQSLGLDGALIDEGTPASDGASATDPLLLARVAELEADGIALQLTCENIGDLASLFLPAGAPLPDPCAPVLRRTAFLGALSVLSLLERSWSDVDPHPDPDTRVLNLAGGAAAIIARDFGAVTRGDETRIKVDASLAARVSEAHAAITFPALFMADEGQRDTGLGARFLKDGAGSADQMMSPLMRSIAAILGGGAPDAGPESALLRRLDAARTLGETELKPWRWEDWQG